MFSNWERVQKSTHQLPERSISRIKRWTNTGVHHFAQDARGLQKHIAEHDLRSFGPKSLLKQRLQIVLLTTWESASQLSPRLQPVVSLLWWMWTQMGKEASEATGRMVRPAQGNLCGIQLLLAGQRLIRTWVKRNPWMCRWIKRPQQLLQTILKVVLVIWGVLLDIKLSKQTRCCQVRQWSVLRTRRLMLVTSMSISPESCGTETSALRSISVNSTPTPYTFFSCTVVAQTCCQSVQSHIDPMRMHGSSHGAHCLRFAPRTLTLHRTGTPSPLILNPSLSEHKPCGDLRPQLSGALAEPPTGSPKGLLKTRITSTSPKTGSSLNTRIYVSNHCPSTNHRVDLRFSGKHRDTAPGIGLRRWATSCSGGLTTVPTGARSKCRTIASSSLWTRQLDVQLISRSDKYREICRFRIGWNKKRLLTEEIFPQDINRFLGATNLSSDSVTRQMLRNLFLMEVEITCLLKRDLNSWSRNTKWNLLTLVSVNFRNKLMLSDWNWRTPILDMQNLEENKLVYKKNWDEGKLLRDIQNTKYSWIGCDEESSRTTSWRSLSAKIFSKNHETIQRLTSQLQDMQEQMNSVNDSGEFQEVESNYSGRLSYVSSQPAMMPSSRSMLNHDKRLPLDTWNTSGLQENVFGNQFSSFDSARDHPQEIHPCPPQRERGSVPQATGSGTLFPRDDKQNRDTIPMPTFAGKPSTMSSGMPVEIPQNSMVGQQWQQISELQFDKFTNPQSFLVWKIRFKNEVSTCSFHRKLCYGSKNGDGSEELKTICSEFPRMRCYGSKKWRLSSQWMNLDPRDKLRERISRFLRCWTQELLLLWDHPEFPFQKEGQSGGTESPERGRVFSRKTDRLHCLRLLSSHWCAWMIPYLILCGFILYQSSKRRCSGFRYEMGWNSMIYDQDPTGWCSGKSVQIENTWVWSTQNRFRIVRHGNSSKDIEIITSCWR